MRTTPAQRAWVLYDAANSAYALIVRSVFAALLFKYCADELWGSARATSMWGYAASLAGIVAGGCSISLGSFADRFRCKKLLLGLFVLVGVLTTAAFVLVGKNMPWTALSLSFISLLCYMCANCFYDALLMDIAPRTRRDFFSSLAYASGYIAGIIPFVLCLWFVSMVKDNQELSLKIPFPIAALWWGVLSVPLFLKVKEKQHKCVSGSSSGFAAIFSGVALAVKNKNILTFLIAYFLYIDGVGTIYMMASPLAMDIGISTKSLLFIILGLQVIAFPFTLLYGSLAKKIHPRKLVNAAIGIYILIALLTGCLPHLPSSGSKLALFLVIAGLVGTSQGGIQSLSRSMFTQIIPPERAAQLFGIYNLFGKFTTIVGPILIGLAASWWGCSEYGILLLIVPFAAGAFLLSRVDFSGKRQ